jgi:diguanylate cyclase (GGDEF)-like protein
MKDSSVLVIVLTEHSDDVAFFNKTLRDAGHRVNCRGLSRLEDLQQALEQDTPQLIVFFPENHHAPMREVVKIRQAYARMSPLIVVQSAVEESEISAAMEMGAQDVVSIDQTSRICSVCERELKTFRLELAFNDALQTATQYKQQLKSLMSDSADAIAQVQEGIVVEANQAWADIFAVPDVADMLGPLMDHFVETSQTALKGALSACTNGQWDNGTVRAEAIINDTTTVPLEIKLEPALYDGEPAVRLSVFRRYDKPSEPTFESSIVQLPTADIATGFHQRQQFLELLTDKLDLRPQGGARALAIIRPDKFGEIEHDVGPVSSEEILVQIAGIISELKAESDIAGRFGGTMFALVLDRGTLRDIEAWADNLLKCVREHLFEVADHSVSLTCSIGLAELGEHSDRVEDLVRSARQASQRARAEGGNRTVLEETADLTRRTQKLDAIWATQVKNALVSGRFRLMHMNIASLTGQSERFFDTFVRMIDEQNDEVPASDFMGTAERMGLLRPIDRWIINASIGFCSSHSSDLVFVKLSIDSVLDDTLVDWICAQVAKANVRPQNLCFQISEEDAGRYQKQSIALAKNLRSSGFRFAIEQFGIGRDPIRVLATTPMDYCKIDGSLMQSVASNPEVQRKIGNFVSQCAQRQIKTIASRVENANTMAVLFQLGVAYMQGHYVHEPEVVLEEVV